MPSIFSVIHLELTTLLAELTETDPSAWEGIEGPVSRCGLDYWYHHPEEGEAHLNIDQTWVTVSIADDRVYEGDYRDDEWLSRFVTQE